MYSIIILHVYCSTDAKNYLVTRLGGNNNFLNFRETAHIKKLARQLLDQRSELEQFFIESLAQVKKEIERNR